MKVEIDGLPKIFEDKGFNNFETKTKYKSHKEICMDFAFNRTEKKSLVLFGGVGTGKSHLAVAIIRNLPPVKKNARIGLVVPKNAPKQECFAYIEQRARAKFLVVDEFFQELNDCAINRESKLQVIQKYLLQYDVVVLDDLGVFNWSAAKQENLYLFVNRAYLDKRRIIITTNYTPDELMKKDERIVSRLKEMALFLEFRGEDVRK